MSNRAIVRIVREHSIPAREENERVYVLDMYVRDGKVCNRWVDATGWTVQRLRAWLGY